MKKKLPFTCNRYPVFFVQLYLHITKHIYMRNLLLLLLCVLTSAITCAQQITGIIKDEQGNALQKATVALKRVRDSSTVKLAVTNQEGNYSFNNIVTGKYFTNVSYVGYASKNSPAFEVNSDGQVNAPEVALIKLSGSLREVAVTATRPMVEVRADKTILNVEGTINAVGQDALELLRKSPGVQVDRDDNLSLSGKNGVQVFIDGKPSPLSGKDLSEYLKTLQSSQIESIEIITNPSAKYEAAGNAGIINIRLKRNKTLGTNGSVNLGYGIGVYSKYNGGIALNHRSKSLNLFGTYNHNHGQNENPFNLYREVADSIFDQHSTFFNRNRSHNFKAGADLIIDKFNTIGVMMNGVRANPKNFSDARTFISYMPTKAGVKQLHATNDNISSRNSTSYNLNFRHTDAAQKDLNIDVDYSNYAITTNQLLTNIYLDAAGNTETSREVNNMISPTDINIYSGKVDYEQNFKKGRLGVGGKMAFIKTDNDFQRYNIAGAVKDLDKEKSNRFRYKENINAAYINYNKQFKGWMIQAGVRLENTVTEGRSTGDKKQTNGSFIPYDSSFKREYTNLFPSAAITFNKNPKNQWSLSYSRRIDRPAYQDLNPFEFKLDAYTYMKGNTELRPQFTQAFGITNIYNFKLTTNLSYSHTDDVFAQLTDVIETSKSFLTRKNLAIQDNIGLNISYPLQYKAYSLFANLNSYYSHYKADLGPQRKVDVNVFSYRFFAQNSLKFAKTYTAELSGWYNGPSIWSGTFKTKPLWSMDAGVQKVIFKGKGNLRMSLSDVFKSIKFTSDTHYAGQYLKVNGSGESRVFRINLSYRFGNTQVKAARQRKTGQEEENQRTNSDGGITR